MADLLTPESVFQKRISRRSLIVGGVGAAAGLALKGFRTWDNQPFTPEVGFDWKKKFSQENCGIPFDPMHRSEFSCMWPESRAWVVANTARARDLLDGAVLKKDTEYSLIDMLKLSQDDIYAPGLHFTPLPPFVELPPAYGLSLTANCIARALATAPVSLHEWHTHASIPPVVKHYFTTKMHYPGNELFSLPGTDATVYMADHYKCDLRFTPRDNLTLRFQVYDRNGNSLDPTSLGIVARYPGSLTHKFTEPVFVRAIVGSEHRNDPARITNKAVTWLENGETVPGFTRLYRRPDGVREEFNVKAHYNSNLEQRSS